jgi:hypothetical protein
MAIVGYRTLDDASTYFLLHNSWGTAFADKGYVWIHEKTLQTNMAPAVYTVEAWPADRAPARAWVPSCKGDTVPDSVTEECSARCADGSPPASAVCAVTTQCPKAQVNLSGACERAAPIGKGKQSGASFACGAGGCTYTVDQGTHECKEASGCQLSCPAPAYRLSDGPGCME